eukprot:1681778-Alexandrium_andersonii.AAC.1
MDRWVDREATGSLVPLGRGGHRSGGRAAQPPLEGLSGDSSTSWQYVVSSSPADPPRTAALNAPSEN